MQFNTNIGILLCSLLQATQAVTLGNAEDGFTTLQQWYNESTGLWIPSTGWWNSANCEPKPHKINGNGLLTLPSGLTVIADLAATDPSIRQRGSSIWTNTYTQAQKYNLAMQKVVKQGFLAFSYYANAETPVAQGVPMPQARRTNGFLNDYYDDEGWWALAW